MITLLKGDCLDVLQEVPDSSVDLIVADLPYGMTRCKWDTPIDLAGLWVQYKRVAKANAAVLMFAQTPFDKILGCSNIKQLRYELIWEKTAATGHLNAKKMPMKAHENILVFYDRLPTYNPQITSGHVRKSAVKRNDTSEVYGKQTKESAYDSTDRYPRSVIKFASDKQRVKLHPTQKPLALMKWLIKTYSNGGGLVLDSCMGSGTSGVAAVELGRRFIGIELGEYYFNVANERISQCKK